MMIWQTATGFSLLDKCCSRFGRGALHFSGAHDVIAITSPQTNDLCTEELREVSLALRKVSLGERGLWS